MSGRAYVVLSIRDARAELYLPPFVATDVVTGMRQFARICGDETMRGLSENIRRWPTDYSLYRVGYYDEDSGLLEALPVPEYLIDAVGAAEMWSKPQTLPPAEED